MNTTRLRPPAPSTGNEEDSSCNLPIVGCRSVFRLPPCSFLPITFPYILGVDVAGTVEALGEGVTGFATGDRVMAVASHSYAELCVASANLLAKIPDGLDVTTAAALPLVTLTGDQLARVGAKVAPGKTVLVTGALGGVGRSAVFAAVESGAIVIAGVRGRRVEEAKKLPGARAGGGPR